VVIDTGNLFDAPGGMEKSPESDDHLLFEARSFAPVGDAVDEGLEGFFGLLLTRSLEEVALQRDGYLRSTRVRTKLVPCRRSSRHFRCRQNKCTSACLVTFVARSF